MDAIKSILTLLLHLVLIAASSNKKAYIVYMGEKMHDDHNVVNAHIHSFLANTLGSSDEAKNSMIHTYKRSFTGFSAMLTEEQASNIRGMDGVVSVFPSKTYKLHTTHSWDFLNTVSSFRTASRSYQPDGYGDNSPGLDGEDVIVGVLDSGVWPESPSFRDEGMSPIPGRWKGICQEGEQFTAHNCNKKLIGARFYTAGFDASDPELQKKFIKSPRDTVGHGSHTASTAVGRVVEGISFPGGLAAGAARGGSPNSRLAVYKVCWDDCKDEDVLAGFDDAIADGVDILSLSLGPTPPQPNYFEESISIGSFHATRSNILVSCSAGNDALPSTVTNISPWILTVAASSIDRKFEAAFQLGNNRAVKGVGINPSTSPFLPLALGKDLAAAGVSSANASFCHANTLDPVKTKGKFVICLVEIPQESRGQKSIQVQAAGGTGMIAIDEITKEIAQTFVLPGGVIGKAEGDVLLNYIKSTRYPTVKVLKTKTILGDKPSPEVAVFSSRGPNSITADIVKPDVTGPGVTILAAWSPLNTVGAGNRTVDYNLLSGTSMACPHITGVATLIKSKFPSWSPAMIKSAIMTTATIADNTNGLIKNTFSNTVSTPFDFGSGHVNFESVLDPGLVYDTSADEYASFLCGLNPSPGALNNLTIPSCPSKTTPPFNLNYPSIGVTNLQGKLSVTRTVKNVGPASSYYKVTVSPPPGVSVSVHPAELRFSQRLEKKSFTVSLTVQKAYGDFVFGALTWTDGKHFVKSPIAVNATY